MARLHEWLDLGRNTVSSLNSDDVANLYSLEWPETRNRLIAEHRAAIEAEPRAIRRWIRTTSAILYGLTKRLAPHRRIFFLISLLAFFVCVGSLLSRMDEPPLATFLQLVAAFLLMTLLLAMELIDKLKFRDELQLARDLQSSLIPREMPRTEQWDIAAYNWIANTVGGDIYDFTSLPDGRVAILFGDASGHGMAAGLVMAVAQASFRTQLDVDPEPSAIVASLNRILCRTGGSRSFFACVYVLLSPDGSFEATVAGHPQILKLDREGHLLERIGRGAYPLGVKLGIEWEVVTGGLEPGERLVLHSDGLTESRNRGEQELGDDRIAMVAARNPPRSSELVEALVTEWRGFMAGIRAEDDVSIAVVTRQGGTAAQTQAGYGSAPATSI